MTDLVPLAHTAAWADDIHEMQDGELLNGGPPDLAAGEGLLNVAHAQLAARTAWLRALTVGQVAHFAQAAPPDGWLVCDGAAVSRAAYAALYAAIGTTYGAGDGSTTFDLPDLRGEFLRGLDGGRGVDPGRTLGSAQGASRLHVQGIGLREDTTQYDPTTG
ncbi:MAG: phage tail protein, partial [Paracoccaceae bacterium]